MKRHAFALTIALLAARAAQQAGAQDSTIAPPHLLAVDSARLRPFERHYDMLVSDGDSTVLIGRRSLTLESTTYNGDSAWLLIETRTGIVTAAESLFVDRTLRPLHWSAVAGLGKLAAEFVGDSIYGATSGPTGKHNIVMQGRPDLLVSAAMTEAVLSALPLAADFHDSVSVLDVSLSASQIVPAEIAVVGEEELLDLGTPRACWVVALREDQRQGLYWVEKSTGITLRMQQLLPEHDGRRLDYRFTGDTSRATP